MSKPFRMCTCLFCGVVFPTGRDSQVYCREACRKAAETARYRARRKEARDGTVPGP